MSIPSCLLSEFLYGSDIPEDKSVAELAIRYDTLVP